MKLSLVIVILGFILLGCSSVDKEQCQVANWEGVGKMDGQYGIPNNYSNLVKVCSAYKISPDKRMYDNGYKSGVKNFCNYQNGYMLGNEGQKMPTVCSPDLHAGFYRGFNQGKSSYDQKVTLEKQTLYSSE